MTELLDHVLILLVPLLLANVLHMIAVRQNWFPALQIPIWRRGFGENKTLRGLLFLPVINALLLMIISSAFRITVAHPAALGLTLGLAYIIFELPNSFIKRRAGITAGGHHDRHKYLFYVLDKTDSAFGVTLVYMLITGISLKMAAALFLINSMTHAIVSFLLVQLRIKSSF
jgi:hypothetical protein